MTSPQLFIKQTRDELKKVSWPSRKEVIRLTGVVILVSAIVGFFIGGMDFVFTRILQTFIK